MICYTHIIRVHNIILFINDIGKNTYNIRLVSVYTQFYRYDSTDITLSRYANSFPLYLTVRHTGALIKMGACIKLRRMNHKDCIESSGRLCAKHYVWYVAVVEKNVLLNTQETRCLVWIEIFADNMMLREESVYTVHNV